jgi:hypothetical protein
MYEYVTLIYHKEEEFLEAFLGTVEASFRSPCSFLTNNSLGSHFLLAHPCGRA